jgi:hypothetical protein
VGLSARVDMTFRPEGPNSIGRSVKYVNLAATVGALTGVISPQEYLERLPELSTALPSGAAAYATEPGHYDFASPRCVHDLKLDRIVSGVDRDEGWLRLGFRHNCWKHEEDLVITYTAVTSFALMAESNMLPANRLGEVILDEVLPHSDGCSHEIACHCGGITIVCRDFTATWVAADCPDKPKTE